MIFKIYLKQILEIVFWSFFNLIKALMVAWFIIVAFCGLLKTELVQN